MSYIHYSWAWTAPDLTAIEKMVLLCLVQHAPQDSTQVFPSIRRICEMTALSERSIRRCLKALQNKEYIVIEPQFSAAGDRTANRYIFRLVRTPENISYATQWPGILKELEKTLGAERFLYWFASIRPIQLKGGIFFVSVSAHHEYEYIVEQKDIFIQACNRAGMRIRDLRVHIVQLAPPGKNDELLSPKRVPPKAAPANSNGKAADELSRRMARKKK